MNSEHQNSRYIESFGESYAITYSNAKKTGLIDISIRSDFSIPVKNNTINVGQFHQFEMIIKNAIVIGCIRSDQRVVIWCDIPFSASNYIIFKKSKISVAAWTAEHATSNEKSIIGSCWSHETNCRIEKLFLLFPGLFNSMVQWRPHFPWGWVSGVSNHGM